MKKAMIVLATLALTGCEAEYKYFDDNRVAIDGDTFRMSGKSYRLVGIDAPEMPGHCRPGRRCVAGDPERSKVALQFFLEQGHPICAERGRDVYGRILVECKAGWSDASINQSLLQLGFAEEYRR